MTPHPVEETSLRVERHFNDKLIRVLMISSTWIQLNYLDCLYLLYF